jgi:eukaryotic-like serine/threonine-protein kinase
VSASAVRGYTLLRPFAVAGGGQCQWTFARGPDGRDYFIKQFLRPKYPVDGSPGSPAVKAQRRERCERFEANHRDVIKRLKGRTSAGGNLIAPIDFFLDGTTYYKVTERVVVNSMAIDEVAALEPRPLLSLMLSVVASLRILHGCQLVHGDLKPDNILLSQSPGSGKTTSKLIDFDDCFGAGPVATAREDMVGDPWYYSPELSDYIAGRGDGVVTCKSDIFALGLVFAEYATGQAPTFDRDRHRYPADAVAAGVPLALEAGRGPLPPGLDELLASMWQLSADQRPDTSQVEAELKQLRSGDPVRREERPPRKVEPTPIMAPGTLKIAAGLASGPSAERSPAGSTPEPAPGRLKIGKGLEAGHGTERGSTDATATAPAPGRLKIGKRLTPGSDKSESDGTRGTAPAPEAPAPGRLKIGKGLKPSAAGDGSTAETGNGTETDT